MMKSIYLKNSFTDLHQLFWVYRYANNQSTYKFSAWYLDWHGSYCQSKFQNDQSLMIGHTLVCWVIKKISPVLDSSIHYLKIIFCTLFANAKDNNTAVIQKWQVNPFFQLRALALALLYNFFVYGAIVPIWVSFPTKLTLLNSNLTLDLTSDAHGHGHIEVKRSKNFQMSFLTIGR